MDSPQLKLVKILPLSPEEWVSFDLHRNVQTGKAQEASGSQGWFCEMGPGLHSVEQARVAGS
jgi:hypothetical protein